MTTIGHHGILLIDNVLPLDIYGFSFDPAHKNANVTLSSGNKTASTTTGGGHYYAACDTPKTSGKWQLEFVVDAVTSGVGNIGIGIADDGFNSGTTQTTTPSVNTGGQYWTRLSGALARLYFNTTFNSLSTTGTLLQAGDVGGFTIDFSTEIVSCYRNGVFVASATSSNMTPGTFGYVPLIKIWGGAGNPTTLSIPATVQYPVSGFSPWA